MNTSIENIQFFEFNYGDDFDGNICFIFRDGKFLYYKQPIGIVIDLAEPTETLSQEQYNLLVATLNDIYLLKWDSEYTNPHINDSIYWNIEIQYNNNKESLEFTGSNAYPQSSIVNGKVLIVNSELDTSDFAKLLSTLNQIVGQEKYFS